MGILKAKNHMFTKILIIYTFNKQAQNIMKGILSCCHLDNFNQKETLIA